MIITRYYFKLITIFQQNGEVLQFPRIWQGTLYQVNDISVFVFKPICCLDLPKFKDQIKCQSNRP